MKSLLLLLSTVLVITACNFKHSESNVVTGEIGKIVVICDNNLWDGPFRECLDTNLTQWILPYLPDVATFDLLHKTPGRFKQGVKRWRNLLFINIDSDYKGEKGSIVERKDVWGKGQLVIDITAKDYNQLVETCSNGLDNVHASFDEMSWKRLIKTFNGYSNQGVRDELKKSFGIDVALPSNSKIVTCRKNFYRIEFPPASRPIEFAGTGTQDVGSIFSGLLVYQYDYTDSTQFEIERLLRARDTMLKYNVPHEIEGLYMGTQYLKPIYPEGNLISNESGTIKGYEMRGMFVFTGRPIHSTGGAFWAFHFINPTTNKLMCLSGYVDAPPTTSWTHPIREIEAILRSVEFAK